MRIIAADDEALMLDMLTDRIRQACPQGKSIPFPVPVGCWRGWRRLERALMWPFWILRCRG